MKYEEYKTTFQTPEEVTDEQGTTVVLACSIVNATDTSCRIRINGAPYEFDSKDIIDIVDISMDRPDDEDSPPGPRTALITVDQRTVLHGLVPIHAAFLAATGTWMWALVPVVEAEEDPEK